jgi:hypothetical protein
MEVVQKCHYHFFLNHKAENYCDTWVDLVQSDKAMGCNMS